MKQQAKMYAVALVAMLVVGSIVFSYFSYLSVPKTETIGIDSKIRLAKVELYLKEAAKKEIQTVDPAEVSDSVLWLLGHSQTDVYAHGIALSESSDPGVRRASVEIFTQWQTPMAIESLKRLALDKDFSVASASVRALGTKQTKGYEVLAALLEKIKNGEMRLIVLESLLASNVEKKATEVSIVQELLNQGDSGLKILVRLRPELESVQKGLEQRLSFSKKSNFLDSDLPLIQGVFENYSNKQNVKSFEFLKAHWGVLSRRVVQWPGSENSTKLEPFFMSFLDALAKVCPKDVQSLANAIEDKLASSEALKSRAKSAALCN